MLIDNDPIVLESQKFRLESWGFKTLVAISFEDAQGLLNGRKVSPNIIISDLRLEGNIDGVQVIQTLQNDLNDQIRGIILTGDTSPDRLNSIEKAGFSVLHKPVKSDVLAEVLNNALDCILYLLIFDGDPTPKFGI